MPISPDIVEKAQLALKENGIDGWLVYDFRRSNPVFWQLLGSDAKPTRRCFIWLPAAGEPVVLGHAIEAHVVEAAGCRTETYAGRLQMEAWLRRVLDGVGRVAMEYSPGGALPVLSWVDGGTLDMVRALGPEVVSSADLYEAVLAVWDDTALESHIEACGHVAEVKDRAFAFVGDEIAAGRSLDEYAVQQFIVAEFGRRGLDMDHPPIVGANAHSGNPHYAPSAEGSAAIGRGDWLLIDLWARRPGSQHVFGDITWVGWVGSDVPVRQQKVFDCVRQARDAVLDKVRAEWQSGVCGWQLDRVAREVIDVAGYGDFFVHRTGHSLGPGPAVHGMGANLDDFETRDTRRILPGTGFTIEPGIYLPEFGVRLEVNVYIDPQAGPQVTTPVQEEVVLLG